MAEIKFEVPVFFDNSRRRWRRVKFWTIGALLAFTAVVAIGIFRIGNLDAIADTPDATTNAQQLAGQLARENVPVIGDGPLARVLKVEGHKARELYRESPPRELTDTERTVAGTHGYLIERYGATQDGRRLVLTFDDGPDPVYTPQILDVLSEGSAQATFFVVGKNVIEHPEIVERIAREGHGLANHSYSHADFESVSTVSTEQELNLTRRAIRATSGYDTTLARPPYVGISDQSLRNAATGILQAQKLGQTVALYDFDTNDWMHGDGDGSNIPLPPFDGQDHVLLVHDSGGNRAATVAYLKRLIRAAKDNGYSFAPMHALYPQKPEYFAAAEPTADDIAAVAAINIVTDGPLQVTWALFLSTVVFVLVGLLLYVLFAIIQVRRTRHHAQLEKTDYQPSVAIIVPAYNEESVLKKCIENLQKSTYQNLRILIIDDGSTDGTWRVARRMARRYQNTRAFRQENSGKAAAINHGIKRTWSPVIISIDADTVFYPDTVERFVRHFQNPKVGAVAGMVEVGNRQSLVARCQALEYSTSISLERTAQAYMNAITVVPGACGAWRRKALVAAGRYSSMTLAEDFDMTLAVHRAGYEIVQDNSAVSVTEAPSDLRTFARQRFRWAFGNAQVFWKYRGLLFTKRRTWLNTLVLPLAIISTVGPMIFLPLIIAITVQNVFGANYGVLALFVFVSLFFQFFRGIVALRLGKQTFRHLLYVPLVYLLYGPLRIYLLYGTVLKASRGDAVGWNKFKRTNSVEINPRKRLLTSRV